MKSVVMLWIDCLKEAGDQYCVRTHRDVAYATSRIEDEGLSFLTIALPAFEKDFLTGITRGHAGSDLFHGFRYGSGGLPTFLSGFLHQVFDTDGSLRADVDPGLIRSIRQVLLLCSKIELPTSKERETDALAAYISTDEMLDECSEHDLAVFRTVSRNLLGSYLSDVESRLWSGDWIPRHSSGANADRVSYNARFGIDTWTERLNAVFPWWEDLAACPREVIDHHEDFSVLAREEEPPSRVALVPKTMKGPRIIAMEPSWMQYTQQGILHVMTEELGRAKNRKISDIFSWQDQEPNRILAREGSKSGEFATLDLSEASDRVSLQLAEALLASHPFLRDAVLACRSERALVPLGKGVEIRLNKFASMGSALCFPIESMVFFIICSIAYAESCGMDPSALRIRDLPRMRVYGDDLIVPQIAAQTLMSRLESYRLKVNSRKSFTTGPFRESCGADWYAGVDVSVFKLRAPLPTSRRQHHLIQKAIDFHNRVYDSGWFSLAATVETSLQRVLGRLLYAPVGMDVSALWTWEPISPSNVRTNTHLHRREFRTFVFRYEKPRDPLSEYGALRKFFTPSGGDEGLLALGFHTVRDVDHLERDGRSQCVGMHTGWTPGA